MSTQNINLQVPLSKELKLKAKRTATKYGFSSVQEVVRVFLTSLVNNDVDPNILPRIPPKKSSL